MQEAQKEVLNDHPHDIVGELSWNGPRVWTAHGNSPVSSLHTTRQVGEVTQVCGESVRFYDRVRALKERDKMLKECYEHQPKTGFLTEESEQDRLIYHRQRMEYERFERQKVAVMAAFVFGDGGRCSDPYEYPVDAYEKHTGRPKQSTLRGIVRFLKSLLENTKYTTVLLQDHNSFDRVECKVFNRKDQCYRKNKNPDYTSDSLVLVDKKTDVVYVAEPFKGNFSYVLLYLKFFAQYTRHPVTYVIEPSFFGGFDYKLLYRVLFSK